MRALTGPPGSRLERLGALCVTTVLALTVAFLLVPVLLTVVMALDSRPFIGQFPPAGLTTRWLTGFFELREYVQGVKTTLLVAAIATGVSTVVGLLAATGLTRYEFRGRAALATAFTAPLIVPGVVLGYGLLGWFTRIGGLTTLERLIIAHVVITLPYTLRVTMAAASGLDRSLEEAAMSLGAHPVAAFRAVTLPLIKPGVFGAAMMAFAVSIGDVPVSVYLTDPATSTLSIAMFSQLQSNMTPSIAVASVYLMGITAVSLYVMERLLGLGSVIGLRADWMAR